jgi:CheY-like chemotaxis protein
MNPPQLNKTILIVEDERPLANAIKIKLELSGFETVTARSVAQALDYLENINEINAIWLDHYLLGQDGGLELIAKIKSHPKWQNIPVFVVTNTGGADKKETYLHLGAKEYFIKSEHKLEEIIHHIKSSLI